MIKIIGDDIFLRGYKVGNITVGTSIARSDLEEQLTCEKPKEVQQAVVTVTCPRCNKPFDEEVFL